MAPNLATMDPYQLFTLSTSAYTTLQALPLLLTPSLIISLLDPEPSRPTTTIEPYLARSLALLLLAFSAQNLLASGLLNSTPSTAATASQTTILSTIYHALSAFYIYMHLTSSGGTFGLYAGVVGSTGLFALGLWTILFGSGSGRMSKSTGADKRTGNWPFENKESAKEVKKDAKRTEKEEREREREKGKRRSVARTGSSRG